MRQQQSSAIDFDVEILPVEGDLQPIKVVETGQVIKLPKSTSPDQVMRIIDGHVRAYQRMRVPGQFGNRQPSQDRYRGTIIDPAARFLKGAAEMTLGSQDPVTDFMKGASAIRTDAPSALSVLKDIPGHMMNPQPPPQVMTDDQGNPMEGRAAQAAPIQESIPILGPMFTSLRQKLEQNDTAGFLGATGGILAGMGPGRTARATTRVAEGVETGLKATSTVMDEALTKMGQGMGSKMVESGEAGMANMGRRDFLKTLGKGVALSAMKPEQLADALLTKSGPMAEAISKAPGMLKPTQALSTLKAMFKSKIAAFKNEPQLIKDLNYAVDSSFERLVKMSDEELNEYFAQWRDVDSGGMFDFQEWLAYELELPDILSAQDLGDIDSAFNQILPKIEGADNALNAWEGFVNAEYIEADKLLQQNPQMLQDVQTRTQQMRQTVSGQRPQRDGFTPNNGDIDLQRGSIPIGSPEDALGTIYTSRSQPTALPSTSVRAGQTSVPLTLAEMSPQSVVLSKMQGLAGETTPMLKFNIEREGILASSINKTVSGMGPGRPGPAKLNPRANKFIWAGDRPIDLTKITAQELGDMTPDVINQVKSSLEPASYNRLIGGFFGDIVSQAMAENLPTRSLQSQAFSKFAEKIGLQKGVEAQYILDKIDEIGKDKLNAMLSGTKAELNARELVESATLLAQLQKEGTLLPKLEKFAVTGWSRYGPAFFRLSDLGGITGFNWLIGKVMTHPGGAVAVQRALKTGTNTAAELAAIERLVELAAEQDGMKAINEEVRR